MSLALWISLAALAAPPPLNLPPDAFVSRRTEFCMPSGLRIVYQHEPTHPTVTWTTVLGTGSAEDPPGLDGLAHLLEHLWFLSADASGETVDQLADRIGAATNGTTRPDDTTYPSAAPAHALGALIAAESRRLTNPLSGVTEAHLDRERDVVRAERRWRYSNSAGLGYLAILEHLFPEGHRYHRAAIGTQETLTAITLADAEAFAAQHYVPGNASWMVTAPHSVEDFRTALGNNVTERLVVGNDTKCRAPRPAPEPPPAKPLSDEPVVIKGRVDQPLAYIAWALPDGFGSRGAGYRVATRRLDAREGWDCWFQPFARAAMAYCVHPLYPPSALNGWEPYKQQVMRTINNDSSGYSSANSATVKEMQWILQQIEEGSLRHGDARPLHHTSDRQWLETQAMLALNIGNGPKATELPPELQSQHARVVIVEPSDEVADTASPRSGRHAAGLDGAWARTADTTPRMHTLDLSSLKQTTLANGLEVWVLPFGAAPFARTRLVLRGGSGTAPDVHTSILYNHFLDDTAGVVESAELEHLPVLIGGTWLTAQSPTTTEYGIRSFSGRVPGQLYLLRKRIERLKLDVDDRVNIMRALREQSWEDITRVDTWAEMAHDRHLTGAAGPWTPGQLARFKAVSTADLRAWKKRVVRPADAILIMVGDHDPDKARRQAYDWFGDWKDKDATPPAPHTPEVPSNPRRVAVFDDPGRGDAEIWLSCPAGERSVAREEPWRVAGGMLAGTLEHTLRGELAVTYAVSAGRADLGNGQQALHVVTDVATDTVGPAVDAVLGLLESLHDGADADAIAGQKAWMARRSVLSLRSASDAEAQLVDAARSGAGLDWLAGREQRLAAVNADAVSDAVAPCVGHELITVVGRAEAVLASLAAADIAAEDVDWQAEQKAWRAVAE